MNRYRFVGHAAPYTVLVCLAALTSGCGVKQEDHQRVVNELQQAKTTLSETEASLASAKVEVEGLKTAGTKANQELTVSRNKISLLEQRIASLEKQDSFVFADIGKLMDSEDYQGALRAYQGFVRDFPGSPRVQDATAQISKLQQTLQRIEQERAAKETRERQENAAREARERQEQQRLELAQRVRAGNLTAYQWWPILRGKTMAEVKELLGNPDGSHDDDREWYFFNKAVTPNSGVKDKLRLFFRGGRVVGVTSDSLNSIIQD
jgi:hypothetical protein